MGSPLASAWLFFHISGCIALVYNGKYPSNNTMLWRITFAWLVCLGMSCFIFAPVPGAASIMFVLAIMPSLALCLRKEHIKPYCQCFGAVIFAYALGLVAQSFLHVTYTNYNLGNRYAWPLLDPNNAAALLNLAFIPCIYLSIFRDKKWFLSFILFSLALRATGSEAGIIEALFAASVITVIKYGYCAVLIWVGSGLSALCSAFYFRPDMIVEAVNRIESRLPIWKSSWDLLSIRPLGGLGLGTFGLYYQQIRTENYTGGWFAHNDVLQIAIEMGIPFALVFCWLIYEVVRRINKKNISSGITIMAVFLGSLIEFQFYVPAVSMAMGLALGIHLLTKDEGKAIMR